MNALEGEALRFGVQQLINQPKSRKVMFLFSDGEVYPGYGDLGSCQKYLRSMIKASEKAGVEVIGFGIKSDHVKHYFPKHVVINNIEDLVTQPLRELENILRKGQTTRGSK